MKGHRFFALLVSRAFLGLSFFVMLISGSLFATPGAQAAAESPALVRVIHASPDIGTADVFVDGALLLSSFPFGAVTNYASVPAGAHQVQIALVGKGINAAVITQTLMVHPGAAYTVAATGAQATNLSLQVFIDNNQISVGASKLRVYQLAPDAGSLNVAAAQQSLINGIPYQTASDYLTVRPGDYQFHVTAPTFSGDHSIAATLKVNMVTSIFAVGLLNGVPQFELLTAQVDGVPGLPNTGSDPNPPALPVAGQSPTPWLIGLLGMISLLCMGSWGLLRYLVRKQK